MINFIKILFEKKCFNIKQKKNKLKKAPKILTQKNILKSVKQIKVHFFFFLRIKFLILIIKKTKKINKKMKKKNFLIKKNLKNNFQKRNMIKFTNTCVEKNQIKMI